MKRAKPRVRRERAVKKSSLATYKPSIVKGEQAFDANLVVIQKKLIALGDLMPAKGKALKFGTPIHTLLIHLGGHPMFVFNDQGNTRCAHDVDTVELTDASLRVVYMPRRGPYSGRVSLSPKIEIFDKDGHKPRQLKSILVNFKATKAQLTRIEKLLASLGDDDGHHH